jgi:hypothetical protein
VPVAKKELAPIGLAKKELAPIGKVQSKFEAPSFKSGNSLPAVEDEEPVENKAKAMFDDLDLDDEDKGDL